MKRCLFRADDAGSCPSANRAVLECLRNGVVRNASLMAPPKAFAELGELFAGLEGVDFGVHVTLTAEWQGPKWGPVLGASRVPSLVDPEGHFWPTGQAMIEAGFDVDEAVAEVRAQIALVRDTGFRPAYIDEHMGIGWLPGLGEALDDLGRQQGLILFKELSFEYLEGVDATRPASLLEQVDALDQGVGLHVTHPGFDAPDMHTFVLPDAPAGVIARERDAERRMMSDPALREALDHRQVQLMRVSDLPR